MSLLKDAMLERDQANGFLIDGFPREMEQAKIFEENVITDGYIQFQSFVYLLLLGMPLCTSPFV